MTDKHTSTLLNLYALHSNFLGINKNSYTVPYKEWPRHRLEEAVSARPTNTIPAVRHEAGVLAATIFFFSETLFQLHKVVGSYGKPKICIHNIVATLVHKAPCTAPWDTSGVRERCAQFLAMFITS